jgi:transcriptional regulator with XRE-family HTH domain
MHVFTLIHSEFKRSGLSKSELALRLGKGKDQISRWLNSPSNMEIDTLSDLLFAISESEASFSIARPKRLSNIQGGAASRRQKIVADVAPSVRGGGHVISIAAYLRDGLIAGDSCSGSKTLAVNPSTAGKGRHLTYG